MEKLLKRCQGKDSGVIPAEAAGRIFGEVPEASLIEVPELALKFSREISKWIFERFPEFMKLISERTAWEETSAKTYR